MTDDRAQKSEDSLSSSYSYSSLVLDTIPIYEDEHEDEYEKNQIRSHAHALRFSYFLHSAFQLPNS